MIVNRTNRPTFSGLAPMAQAPGNLGALSIPSISVPGIGSVNAAYIVAAAGLAALVLPRLLRSRSGNKRKVLALARLKYEAESARIRSQR